ncbi:MAG: ClbS/DfsB family four-helix bundle protein [Chloroflexi bacterium]|nr:ClbS/DfsB family four-helix bundle protein [Chloroflexota bacterium]
MSDFKQRTLDYLEIEWGTYVERFNRWPVEEGQKRVRDQGYKRFRDMLAHVLAWWEEGMDIIFAIAEGREYARKKYDFDAFNAEAVARYKDWDEAKFLAHFEKTRQNAAAGLRSMQDAAWENRLLQRWVDGIFIEHAREHCVAAGRFIVLDTLGHGWKSYIENFEKIEDKDALLKKNGVGSLRELLGHVIGWWETGEEIIRGVLADPNFDSSGPADTDAFNAALIETYQKLSDEEVRNRYETKRRDMIKLINDLPESAFANATIEGWLAADVVAHFDEHRV